jgi:hypothetical protein
VAEITNENSSASQVLGWSAALRRLFRPVVRLLIARSVGFPLAATALRSLYVEVAEEEFPVAGKRQTDSRISLLTGVHRKDVKRLRGERHRDTRTPAAASLGTRLITRWMTEPEYLDADGKPRPLPRVAREPGGPSFESLVRALSTDIRPRAILDEWQHRGLVHVGDDGDVTLDVDAFIPPQGSQAMTHFFSRNLHDHIAAAVHNMLGEGAPFLERSVNYNNLGADAVEELTTLARQRGMELLKELNARAAKLQKRDSGKPASSHRVNVGVYLYSEDEDHAPNEEPES